MAEVGRGFLLERRIVGFLDEREQDETRQRGQSVLREIFGDGEQARRPLGMDQHGQERERFRVQLSIADLTIIRPSRPPKLLCQLERRLVVLRLDVQTEQHLSGGGMFSRCGQAPCQAADGKRQIAHLFREQAESQQVLRGRVEVDGFLVVRLRLLEISHSFRDGSTRNLEFRDRQSSRPAGIREHGKHQRDDDDGRGPVHVVGPIPNQAATHGNRAF